MRTFNALTPALIAVVAAVLAPQFSLAQYSISTIAGGGPNGLAAASASIGYGESIAFDSKGNAYVANSYQYANQILKISSGTVTVVAGNGTAGYSGDGGPAVNAALNQPEGVSIDKLGNIFIADTENNVIREVVAATGNIQTVAGTYYDDNFAESCEFGGDGGPATSATLCEPFSVFVDGSGNIFIADFGNSVVREVVTSTGRIETIAGTPDSPGFSGDGTVATSAQLDLPGGVFVDAAGNIFIADTFNSVIRVVNPGTEAVTIANVVIQPGDIKTVAGQPYDSVDGSSCVFTGDTGPALSAYLCLPYGVAVDSSENIFAADYGNFAIRKVIPAGTISTVAGTLGVECTNYSVTTASCGDTGLATAATLNYPGGLYIDGSDDIYIADTQDFEIREVSASNGNIQPFAGNATLAYSGDGGAATSAELNNPGAVFVDASNNVLIADTTNSVIREIVATTGDIQTVAGNGLQGYSGDGVSPTATELNLPGGVFVDASGNIFIADTGNSAIREVVASTGLIQTVAGTPGTAGYSGDGGPATSAQLGNPNSVYVDASGNLYIADTDNSAIRVVNTGTSSITVAGVTIAAGDIQTVAGTLTVNCDAASTTTACGDGGLATSAYLNNPNGVFLDSAGDIFIADSFDNVIREVSAATGIIQTVAGTLGFGGFSGDGGTAASAALNTPSSVWIDPSNDIFIADSANAAIREVIASTLIIQTIAGIPASTGGFPTPGFSGDGGIATSAELNYPSGVYGTTSGKLFIADTNNSRVRQLGPAPLTVTVAPSSATVVINALQQFTATVTGNANTSVTWYVNGIAGGNSMVGTISTTGLFQGPATVPTTPTVTIAAVSQVDNTTTGSAQATIANPSATISITISPSTAQLYTSGPQLFAASVTGTTNAAVYWYVEGQQGGNATFGTIDTSGNYTAPATVPSPATFTIEAVSQADPSAIGTGSITIVAAPSATSPPAQTVSPGGTASYSLALNGGSPTQPITLSCLQSTLPSGAACTFSPTSITPGNSVPFSLAVTVPATAAAALRSARPGSKGWSSGIPIFAAFLPMAGLLLIGGTSRKHRRLPWLPMACLLLIGLAACGGNNSGGSGSTPVTYNIKVQGTTTAQPTPVTITTVPLIVQ